MPRIIDSIFDARESNHEKRSSDMKHKTLNYEDITIINKCLDRLIMPTEDIELCENFIYIHNKIKLMLNKRKPTLSELNEKLDIEDQASGQTDF